MVELSIVIPCYNEEKNIPLIVKQFKKAKPRALDAELILVNNGSTDNSSKVIKKVTSKNKFIREVTIKKNIGYGNGIWSGLKQAKGEYICWTHGDVQTPLRDTIEAYNIARLQKTKDILVKGERKGRPIMDIFFTAGMSAFETLLLGKVFRDINAQPNLFHKNFLRKIETPPKDFAFDLFIYYLAKQHKYTILRFPVRFDERIHGTSSWNTSLLAKYKFIKRTMKFSWKLRGKLR